MSQGGIKSSGGGGSGVETLTGNSGGAVSPSAGNINVVGSGSITVTGNPGTHTLTISDSESALVFDADSGSATPSAGTITMAGDHGINTSGSGSTVTYAINNTITLGDLSPVGPGVSSLVLQTGDLSIDNGNLNIPETTSADVGVINQDGSPFIHSFGTQNIFIGSSDGITSGNFTLSGGGNTGVSGASLGSLTTGSQNVSVGYLSSANIQDGINNTAIGYVALQNLVSGTNNIALGGNAGSIYAGSESNNIMIGHAGMNGDNNITRIGTNGDISNVYIAGIDGVDVGPSTVRVVSEGSDLLGTVDLTAGTGITITPSSNAITIAADNSLAQSTTYVDSSPYGVLDTDDVLLVDTVTIGLPSTILLPDAALTDGRSWTVKDWSGGASTNPITVTTVSGITTIDGATTYVMDMNYDSFVFTYSLGEGTYSITASYDPAFAGGIVTINGDAGSITGATVSFTGGSSGAVFTGSGTTMTESFNFLSLPVTDNIGNGLVSINGVPVLHTYGTNDTFVGGSGNFTTSGNDNTAVGFNSMVDLTTGAFNVAVGNYALQDIQDGQVNTAVGYQCMAALVSGGSNCSVGENGFLQLTDGNFNLGMGQFSGANYTSTESSNIVFNHGGVVAENNTLRIGAATGTGSQELAAAFICGIDGVDVGSSTVRVVSENADQLGTVDIVAGTGIVITPSSNAITISSNGASSLAYTNVNTSPYVVLVTDSYLSVDCSGSPIIIQLPDTPVLGQTFVVKDRTGSCLANNITVTTVSGSTMIDAGTSFVMNSAYESINIMGNGVSYEIY